MGTMTEITSASEAAALWWAEQIAGRPIHDNGDRSESAIIGIGLAAMAADKHPFTDEQVETFRTKLVAIVDDRLANLYSEGGSVGLHTDYGPDQFLGEAADAAGLAGINFPWKTNTWVYRDHFVVSAGYQARMVLVWADPSWVRPTCHQQEWSLVDNEFVYHPRKCGLPLYHEGDDGEWLPSPLCSVCAKPESYFTHQDDGSHREHEFAP